MAQKPTYHKISRLAFCKLQDWKRKSDKGKCSFVAQGRDEATRTPDPYVPNVVRYQLRYIPILRVIPKNRLQRYIYFLKYVHEKG